MIDVWLYNKFFILSVDISSVKVENYCSWKDLEYWIKAILLLETLFDGKNEKWSQ